LTLIQFVDRVERRSVEQKRAEAAAKEERLAAARAEIPSAAFSMSIDALGLADHIHTILTAAEYHTIGDLMMAMKLDPDSVLGLSGIGPKAMQAIETALANVSYPEPEAVAEPTPEVPIEAGEAVPQIPVVSAPEAVQEAAPAAGEAVKIEAAEEPAAPEKPLEEIFTLKPEMLQPVAVATEEEEDESDKKKGKKKKKKAVEIVFDEDLEKTVAKKKHKRGGEDLLDEW
jgi:hypothetical protein